MSEWINTTLGSVLNFRRGYDLPKKDMINGDIPVAGSNGVIGWHNKATNISPCLTIGRSGSVGKPYFYEKAWAHNTVLYVDDFKNNDPKFLYYLIQTLPLAEFQAGSAVPTLNRNHIHPIQIKFPPSTILQKRIAAILSSLDDKIETNRAINARLEELAAAIFKSWFIDFEPFADGEFIEDENGRRPKGWRKVKMDDFSCCISGYSYTRQELQPSSVALATIKNFNRRGGFKSDGYKEIVVNAKCKTEQHVDLFDILVAHTDLTQNAEIIGSPIIILDKCGYDDLVMSMDLSKIVPINFHVSNFVIYNILKTKSFKNHALGYVNGTTVLHLSKKAVPEYEFYIPEDLSLLDKLTNLLNPIYKEIANKFKENRLLNSLRDALLPRLMSGELIPE